MTTWFLVGWLCALAALILIKLRNKYLVPFCAKYPGVPFTYNNRSIRHTHTVNATTLLTAVGVSTAFILLGFMSAVLLLGLVAVILTETCILGIRWLKENKPELFTREL